MAAAIAQSKGAVDAGGSVTSIAATFDNAVTVGSVILAHVHVYADGSGLTGVSDNKSNPGWASQASVTYGTDANFKLHVWRVLAATGGSSFTVTAAISFSTASYATLSIHEVTGAGDVVQTNTATAASSGGSVSGAAITPTANGLHVGAVSGYAPGSLAVGSGWVEVIEVDEGGTAAQMNVERRTAVNGASQTPTWTVAASTDFLITHVIVSDAGAKKLAALGVG